MCIVIRSSFFSTTHHSWSHILLYHTHQIGSLGHSTSTSHGNHHPAPEEQHVDCICSHVGHSPEPWPGTARNFHGCYNILDSRDYNNCRCSKNLLHCWMYYDWKLNLCWCESYVYMWTDELSVHWITRSEEFCSMSETLCFGELVCMWHFIRILWPSHNHVLWMCACVSSTCPRCEPSHIVIHDRHVS